MEKNVVYKQGMPFVGVTFPIKEKDGLLIEEHDLENRLSYLNENDIRSVYICHMGDYSFFDRCRKIEHLGLELEITPAYYEQLQKRKNGGYEYEYHMDDIYHLSGLKGLNIYYGEIPGLDIDYRLKLDFQKFPHLEYYYGKGTSVVNLGKAYSLKTLALVEYKKQDLSEISGLRNIDIMELTTCSINSLNGIEEYKKLQCMYLYYNRGLKDISALRGVKKSLKVLTICKCQYKNDQKVENKNVQFIPLNPHPGFRATFVSP